MPRSYSAALPIAYVVLRLLILLNWLYGLAILVLLTVKGGGHVVPQPHYRPRRLLGRATSAIDGPAEAWAFFRNRRGQ